VTHEEKLAAFGFTLTPLTLDAGRLLHATFSGNLVFTSGQVSIWDGKTIKGKVGADVSLDQAREAARICTVNCLRAIKSLVGSLDRITRIVKILGMVNVAPGFDQTPAVIDACSELLIDVFGEAGKHARSAVGMTIPLNFAVEIEMIAEVQRTAEQEFQMLPQ
jgi:enamine deaminase RidA (YjgF/YER057c/UK114 family)